ncbi:MAG: hypothetical protein COV72_04750 [Candidatus Omnitrophica bacterium CG11_big_fil_rev_8_21_14_0_20_42_13]|uniref:Uncharacterized protein n=1 Tax=Candidatus Ghiorseimicrobium undicola TaxID=1974746 RepID=A0A2H0LXK0_9BACT|nr:MAG: hypothetical protein COV72_04750 [Candidatus Omnitrophica bacterium CG11_big_fil_rev_8_21_14_0_20_42_13]
MKGVVCSVCGFIAINNIIPDKCPACGAARESFRIKDDAIKTPQDKNNLNEAEKKHIPAITLVKKCGLIPEGCEDAHAKIGVIQHPMEEKHYITHLDFYLDKEFISRVMLTPRTLNPAAALHIKASGGTLSVIELCNIHGAWISEADL